MKSANKKLVAGILAGAMLTGIGVNAASAKSVSHADKHQRPAAMQKGQMPQHPPVQMSADDAAKKVHDTFGVDEKEVKSAIEDGKDIRDIGQAAMFANISGKSFKEVMDMKTDTKDWPEVGKDLGITREQVQDKMATMQVKDIAEKAAIDENTAVSLLKNGYRAHDIVAAGVLAKAANKDIQSVLDMKKINNRWGDVADQLGVDKSVLKVGPGPQEMNGHGPQGGPPPADAPEAPEEPADK